MDIINRDLKVALHEFKVISALYVSEMAYAMWDMRVLLKDRLERSPLYYKTRAIVIHDRLLNDERGNSK